MGEIVRLKIVACLLSCGAVSALLAGIFVASPALAQGSEFPFEGGFACSNLAEEASLASASTACELPETVFTDGELEASGELPSEDERFAGYVDRLFETRQQEGLLQAQKVTRGSLLEGQEKLVYDRLSERICEVASGEEESTVIAIPLSELGIKDNGYTAHDLGLDSVFDANNPSVVSDEARAAVNARFNVALMRILNATLSDHPYELYWYDKTTGIAFEPPSISAVDNNEGGAIIFARPYTLTFKMYVSADYSPGNVMGGFVADTDKTSAASSAATAAAAIVAAHAGESDLEKLHAYMETVAKLTDYDYVAIQNYEQQQVYGDPWQVIHVFDGDLNTKVVCEGYSKAFQYLCDLSEFADAGLACNSVSGEMLGGTGSGPHMWNIVSIGGANYLVDVTNNDNYTGDDPNPDTSTPNDELFLAGAAGTVDDGYRVIWPDASGGDDNWISYYYDEETLRFFSSAELTLSAIPYSPDNQGGQGGEHGAGNDPSADQQYDADRAAETALLINAIGKVAYDDRTSAAIQAARASYDALTDAQKALVTNAAALLNAEARYKSLKAAASSSSSSGSSDSAGQSSSSSSSSPSGNAASQKTGKKAKKVTSVTVNAKTVSAKSVKKAVGKNKSTVTTIVIGQKAKKIDKAILKSFPNVRVVILRTKKLKDASVKNCLKSSKVKIVKVQVGSAKANRSYANAYKKLFVKKVVGKKVTVRVQ